MTSRATVLIPMHRCATIMCVCARNWVATLVVEVTTLDVCGLHNLTIALLVHLCVIIGIIIIYYSTNTVI